jgi:hypothetical protein
MNNSLELAKKYATLMDNQRMAFDKFWNSLSRDQKDLSNNADDARHAVDEFFDNAQLFGVDLKAIMVKHPNPFNLTPEELAIINNK